MTGPATRRQRLAGWIISGACALFLLFDAGIKITKARVAVEGTVQLGYPEAVVLPLGIVLLLCTVLYLIPRTAVLGGILLTGYLGGATATHLRVGQPFLFPVIFGVVAWIGLTLRSETLRFALFGDRQER